MFDLTIGENSALENSDCTKKEKGEDMNSVKNKLINSPALLSGMSHEMRTHMNAIVAFSFLLKDSCSENPESEDISNQILRSCEQLMGLFDSYLDSAIIDTEKSNSYSKICNLNNLISDLISELMEDTRRVVSQDVKIISDIKPSDSIEVYIDTNRVYRVIRSLFQNAVRNTNTGYIRIGFTFIEDILTFHIIDSGQGYFKCNEFIQTKDLNESLARYNDTSAALDITLARKIIHLSGGSIWLDCNGLSGCAIYFTMPARVTMNINHKTNINSMMAI